MSQKVTVFMLFYSVIVTDTLCKYIANSKILLVNLCLI